MSDSPEQRLSDPQMRLALLEYTHSQAWGLCRFAVAMYLFLAVSHQFAIPEKHIANIMTGCAALSALCFVGLVQLCREPSAKNSSMMQVAGLLLLSLNSLLHLYLEQQLIHSSMVMLILVASGGFVIEKKLYFRFGFLVTAVWLAIAAKLPDAKPELVHYSFGLGLSLAGGGFLIVHRQRALRLLILQQLQLRYMADVDWLTGCLRRHALVERLTKLLDGQTKQSCGVLYCDLDHFKQLNDQLGHGQGDEALRRVGKLLQGFAEQYRLEVARYGGEEFVLAGFIDAELLAECAEQLRKAVFALNIPSGLAAKDILTLSIGTACRVISPEGLETLSREADQALYQAKQGGRNRVVAA